MGAAAGAEEENAGGGEGVAESELQMLRHELSNAKVSLAEAINSSEEQQRDARRKERQLHFYKQANPAVRLPVALTDRD